MLTTTEFANFLIHFETAALLGSVYMAQTICLLLSFPSKRKLIIYILSISKISLVNAFIQLAALTSDNSQFFISLAPIINIVWSILFISYTLWCSKLSYLHVQLAVILGELLAVAFITVPLYALNYLLNPTWSINTTSGFTLTNGLILVFCGVLSFGINRLAASKMSSFHNIKFSKKYIWYCLITIYYAVAFSSNILINTVNPIFSFLFQFALIICGILIIYTLSMMIRRREERRIYLEHKYLLMERTLLQEYQKTVELQIEKTLSLHNNIQQAKAELNVLSNQLMDYNELHSYITEVESMLDQHLEENPLL